MIGNPNWFEVRKYGGWGVRPATWQGWVYIAAIIILLLIIMSITGLTTSTRTILSIFWLVTVCIDVLDIMIHIKKDEREYLNEGLAERNAAWLMSFFLICGILYQIQQSIMCGIFRIDPLLLITLIGGALIKFFTFLYLQK